MRRAEWRLARSSSRSFPSAIEGSREEFFARIAVLWDDATTGEDTATVAFVDGWMVVDGERASFALRPCDVSVRWDGSITLAGGGWVRFDVDDRRPAFQSAIRDWGRIVDSPTGEPIFPPLEVQREIVFRETRSSLWAAIPFSLAFGFWLVGGSWIVGVLCAICALAGVSIAATTGRSVGRLRVRAKAVTPMANRAFGESESPHASPAREPR